MTASKKQEIIQQMLEMQKRFIEIEQAGATGDMAIGFGGGN